MDPTYQAVAEFAQQWGLIYFSRDLRGRAGLRAVAFAQEAIRRSRAHSAAGGLIGGRRTQTNRRASPAPRPPATNGTACTNSTRRCRAGGCGLFYACIVWAVGYWIVYPAWPLISNSTQGVFGWHSRAAVETDLDALQGLARPDGRQSWRPLRSRRSSPIRSCSISRARRGAWPSPTIARPATAPAAAAPRAIPISTTTTGCGAASSPTSSRPSATAPAPATTRATRATCRPSPAF